MKILYHHRIASKDGQYVHVEELTNAFLDQGHELKFVAPQVNEQSDFGHDGGFVSKLKNALPAFIYELLELTYSLWIFIKLVKAIKEFKPEFIYERYNLYQPAGILAAKLFNVPLILEVNAPLVEERSRYSGLSLKRFAKWIENYTWKGADHCLPVTDVLADHLRDAGVNENKITVIHNGVRQPFIDEMLATPIDLDKQQIIIGFTGFIHPWHGMDKAIEAIAEHKDLPLKLVCIGDGTILPELKQQAADLGIADKVEFKGLITRDKVLDFVKQFDISLQPDVTAYASPLKMFEYMAVGSLIIAPKTPNIEEILSDDTAVFFEKGNQASFKSSLNDAIVNYQNYIEKREAVKNSVIEKRFVWHENSKRVIEIANLIKSSQRK
ncbi:glycosyltransferase family 4 protein [Psychrosphaera sp. B3R10]|uniref:glycosyltransferase family 4 protein n=1 Tax=unclassified Psychrosphaera TaxID=2641570 RepID=UPI001C0973D4|nr:MULTISPECIES: glycosyltransferase family 4 protein [unclassified Psychrosphaera]MBU2883716.1 glycosyltransferase family 4 protein [Psychrosphaera sp. I2R16]MBU2987982.1 glycosyltransferase family 4 protein [Psychrosphaera sp. B3R10]